MTLHRRKSPYHSSMSSYMRLFVCYAMFAITILFGIYIAQHLWRSEVSPITTSTNLVNNFSTSTAFIQPNTDKPKEKRCYPLLINYAQGCCKKAQKNNCLTGLRHGMCQCLSFDETIFNDDIPFVQRNKHILDRTRGAGYWLWKPYLIFRELYLAKDGDIIVYSDAAADIIADVTQLTKLTRTQDVIVFHHLAWKEYMWTKRDAFIILNVDKPEYAQTRPNLASFIVVKKSFISMAFISEWLTYAQDSRVITDEANALGVPNYDGFRENRHDQTILSLLAKKWNLTTYPNPAVPGGRKRQYPAMFYHHRIRN